MRRQGSALLMLRQLYHLRVFLVFSLKDLVSLYLYKHIFHIPIISFIFLTFQSSNLHPWDISVNQPCNFCVVVCLIIIEFEKMQRDEPLPLPPKPPQDRNWKGSIIAPFSGNNMLVLYHCPSNDSSVTVSSGGYKSKYFVRVLHNESPVTMSVSLN